MLMVIRYISILVFLLMFGAAWASGKVYLEAGFETGEIQRNTSVVDGFYIQTLPNPQINEEGISSGSGGFGPNTNWDTRVVPHEQVGNDVVKPRAGNFFLRSAIYWEKDYRVINGNNLDVPRSSINFAGTGAGQAFEYDEEVWIGFSIFLPSNWEHELGVRDNRGSVVLLSLSDHMRRASNASLSVWTPQGSDKAHWQIHINIHDSAVGGTAQITHPVDLGSVEPDLGKWTDFVIRLRVNPFKTTTNPAKEGIQDSKDRIYEGNKGVMQLWKAEGVNRDMILKIDKVNTPVGYVPHATRPIEVSFRVYKYGWRNNPTTVEGPIWVGFDEMRYGATVRHGTRYEDVLPSNGPEIQQAPRPPSIVVQ